jgi:predicted TIM-barrel fold metal-dependent hydrolase
VKLAYAEGQLGWIPYILERADKVWHDNRGWGGVGDSVPEPPSTYYYRQMFACFFDDEFGLTEGALAKIGERNILFETDYPHSDSTWPHTKEVATKLMGHLPDETVRRLVRGNAIELYQLDLPA